MARFSVSGRTTIVGTATLPNVSLYATAAVRPQIIEVDLFNTGAASVEIGLYRLTTAGTQGAGLTEDSDSMPEQAAVATGFAGHTVAPTLGVEKKRAVLAAGAGILWTWGDNLPLVIPDGTANGVGVIVPTGTGQTLTYSISWIE
jgi:hypothetical protein